METMEWLYYIMGGITGTLFGSIISIGLMRGKPIFYRFVLKKTPVEPVIIGTSKISVPMKKIENNMFEFEGNPYIAPPERMIPKSLLMGSVSAVYIEGVPMPLEITQRTIGFKLTDNSILCGVLRSVLNDNSLSKLFSKEKITHKHLLIVIMVGIIFSAITMQLVMSINDNIPMIMDNINNQIATLKTAAENYAKEAGKAGGLNPLGPKPVPTPPGG
jgi:hypothetical protein